MPSFSYLAIPLHFLKNKEMYIWVSQNISGMYCFKTVYYLNLYGSIIFHTTTLIFNALCPLGYKFLYAPRKKWF